MKSRLAGACIRATLASVFPLAHAVGQGTPSSPTVWMGSPIEEYARVLQLTGVMPLSSEMIRPAPTTRRWTAPDTAAWRAPWRRFADPDTSAAPGTREVSIRALDSYSQLTYNMAFPRGGNDGALWAGRGFSFAQTLGARALWRWVTLDIAPTYTWSQNQRFTLCPQYITKANASPYADQYNGLSIDMPQRFGDASVSALDAGQSSLTVVARGARIGVAKRNMWWGPASTTR